RLAALLTPTGLLYLTVPNVVTNTIDAFLADHLSHFSVPSLTTLLQRCGLRPIVLSEHHQLGQITLAAMREPALAAAEPVRPDGYVELIEAAITRWIECGTRLKTFLGARPASAGALCVYGAGVFGSYLALHTAGARGAITCFLDQSPFKVGTTHLGRPVVHPRQIPGDVTDVLVGLSPARARDILAQAGLLERRGLRFFFP